MRAKIIWIGVIALTLYLILPPVLKYLLGQPDFKNKQSREFLVNKVYKPEVTPLVLNPQDPSQTDFGELTLKWAYKLRLDYPEFGGISSLALFNKKGDEDPLIFKLLNDRGTNMTFTVEKKKDKHDFSVSHFTPITPCYRSQEILDSEALALFKTDAGRTIPIIVFERDHCATRNGHNMPLPKDFENLEFNGGIEAMSITTDGRLIMVSEEPEKGAKYQSFWISTKKVLQINDSQDYEKKLYQAPKGYSPTDLTTLSDGSLLVLHRRWRPTEGTNIIISHLEKGFDQKSDPALPLKARKIAHFGPKTAMDNMEGIAAQELEDGTIKIFVISDDNFNRNIQNNIMVSFDWNRPE